MENDKEVIERFKIITDSLEKADNWKSVTLQMEVYEREPGNGFIAWCIDNDGNTINIDADVQYEFMFNFKIFSWHKETSIGENRWNKAEFTVIKDGQFT